MQIPKAWKKATGECRTRDNRALKLSVWGWGMDDASAGKEAATRLDRLMERIRRGEPFPSRDYAYGDRPLREEILETFDGEKRGQPAAVITRNRYGASVLNAARLLFLDIDLPPATFGQRFRRLFTPDQSGVDDLVLERLKNALRDFGRASFRIYRTAAGFRAMAVDREFDPTGRDVQELMEATGTDPAFSRLCSAQKSFRARLTPKPWRCKSALPPGQFPRQAAEVQEGFTGWVRDYERASEKYATCRYLEAVGSGTPEGMAERLISLHDRVTRCSEALPLA